MKYNSIIVGGGEVGTSLKKALETDQNKTVKIVDIKDKNYEKEMLNLECDALHITFPFFNKEFILYCKKYIKLFKPAIVIIHSTVEIGITEKLQKFAKKIKIVHSPVRGQHPSLTESLLYFVKYIGTPDKEAYQMAAKEMNMMNTRWINSFAATELGKILSTSYYGVVISWHREMKKICDKFGVSFQDAVTEFNNTYNLGYEKFRPNVIRPVLFPPEGPIGGHCVVPNAKILKKQIKSKFLDLIK